MRGRKGVRDKKQREVKGKDKIRLYKIYFIHPSWGNSNEVMRKRRDV